MGNLRVALYSEIYFPIRNGVVTSVDSLARGLDARGIPLTCHVPSLGTTSGDRHYVRRIAAIPLLTTTGYRFVLPHERVRERATIVHAHSPFVTGMLARRAARRERAPLVFTYHTRLGEYAHYAPVDARLARAALDALTRRMARASSVVIAPSRSIVAELRRIGVVSRIEVVPTSADPSFASGRRDHLVRDRLGVNENEESIVWTGRLGREKNVGLALAAFAALDRPRARLAIVGDGVLRARLERMARDLGIASRTTFCGEIPHEAMPDVYASADVLLFTSTTETQGLVLEEARCAGVPVVAVDTPVSREVAGPYASFAPASARGLAAALDERLSRPSPRRSQRPEDFVEFMIALYRSLLAS